MTKRGTKATIEEDAVIEAEFTPQAVAEEVAVKRVPGYIGATRVKRFVCDWLTPVEGSEPLIVEMNVSMSLAENERWGELIASEPTLAQLWPVLAPRVRSWNAMAPDLGTGEYEPIPPPAEMGIDAFTLVDGIVTSWLAVTLRLAQFTEKDRPKASASTPAPASVAD